MTAFDPFDPNNREVQAALKALRDSTADTPRPKPEPGPGPFATPLERADHHLERIAVALESIAQSLSYYRQ